MKRRLEGKENVGIMYNNDLYGGLKLTCGKGKWCMSPYNNKLGVETKPIDESPAKKRKLDVESRARVEPRPRVEKTLVESQIQKDPSEIEKSIFSFLAEHITEDERSLCDDIEEFCLKGTGFIELPLDKQKDLIMRYSEHKSNNDYCFFMKSLVVMLCSQFSIVSISDLSIKSIINLVELNFINQSDVQYVSETILKMIQNFDPGRRYYLLYIIVIFLRNNRFILEEKTMQFLKGYAFLEILYSANFGKGKDSAMLFLLEYKAQGYDFASEKEYIDLKNYAIQRLYDPKVDLNLKIEIIELLTYIISQKEELFLLIPLQFFQVFFNWLITNKPQMSELKIERLAKAFDKFQVHSNQEIAFFAKQIAMFIDKARIPKQCKSWLQLIQKKDCTFTNCIYILRWFEILSINNAIELEISEKEILKASILKILSLSDNLISQEIKKSIRGLKLNEDENWADSALAINFFGN